MRAADVLRAHVLACGLFSRVLLHPPGADFLEALAEGDVFRDWPPPASSRDTERGLAELTLFFDSYGPWAADAVLRDHGRLFVGPRNPVALWESVWTSRDGLVCGESTLEVRRIFAAYGLAAPGAGREPDDHLGLEFAFMAHLLTLGAEALENGDSAGGRVLAAEARVFLEEHPGAWGPRCLEKVVARARTGYYRGLARLGRGLLAEMPGRLAQVLEII